MKQWAMPLKGLPKLEDEDPAVPAVAVWHEVFAFGGCMHFANQIQVHVFNTVTFLWTMLSPVTDCNRNRPKQVPSWRKGLTAVLIDDTVYICGGVADGKNTCSCRPYAFDVSTHGWSKPAVSGTVPEARINPAACVLERIMYLHGGWVWCRGYANDMHKLDTRTMVWSAIVPADGQMPPRSGHHSARVIGTKVFVFGGEDLTAECNYVRVFDTTASCWQNHRSTRLHSRGQSAFTWRGGLYTFGSEERGMPQELWKLCLETHSWKMVHCEGKRGNTMCCCVAGDRLVFYQRNEEYKTAVHHELCVLELSPSLKTLCKLVVIRLKLKQTGLSHNVRWELEAMTGKKHPKPTEKTLGKVL